MADSSTSLSLGDYEATVRLGKKVLMMGGKERRWWWREPGLRPSLSEYEADSDCGDKEDDDERERKITRKDSVPDTPATTAPSSPSLPPKSPLTPSILISSSPISTLPTTSLIFTDTCSSDTCSSDSCSSDICSSDTCSSDTCSSDTCSTVTCFTDTRSTYPSCLHVSSLSSLSIATLSSRGCDEPRKKNKSNPSMRVHFVEPPLLTGPDVFDALISRLLVREDSLGVLKLLAEGLLEWPLSLRLPAMSLGVRLPSLRVMLGREWGAARGWKEGELGKDPHTAAATYGKFDPEEDDPSAPFARCRSDPGLYASLREDLQEREWEIESSIMCAARSKNDEDFAWM